MLHPPWWFAGPHTLYTSLSCQTLYMRFWFAHNALIKLCEVLLTRDLIYVTNLSKNFPTSLCSLQTCWAIKNCLTKGLLSICCYLPCKHWKRVNTVLVVILLRRCCPRHSSKFRFSFLHGNQRGLHSEIRHHNSFEISIVGDFELLSTNGSTRAIQTLDSVIANLFLHDHQEMPIWHFFKSVFHRFYSSFILMIMITLYQFSLLANKNCT